VSGQVARKHIAAVANFADKVPQLFVVRGQVGFQ
jgi:hypothetical protein